MAASLLPAATFRPEPVLEAVPPIRSVESRDGLLWVDQALKVQVTNPKGADGRYPVMEVPDTDSVVVTVNGDRVVGERVVEETDSIQIRLPVVAPRAVTTVTVSPDGMEAVLTVSYSQGERRILPSTTPAPRLTIAPNVYPIDPMRVTLAQVRTELARCQVTEGIIPADAIEAFLDRGESDTLVVARGRQPTPGFGTLEVLQPDEVSGLWVVEPGAIIGRRLAEPARPGMTVMGHEYFAPSVLPGHEVRIGPGVALMGRGTYLVAHCKGYVVCDSQIVDVVPQHELDDVGPDGEPLVAMGDLTIRGDIVGRQVLASGNLQVFGDVRQADIAVGGAIHIRGTTTDATITMGIGRYASQRSRHHITRLIDGLHDLELTIEELQRRVRPDGPDLTAVLARVIPTKFADILESLAALESAMKWPLVQWFEGLARAIDLIRQHFVDDLADDMIRASLWALRAELEGFDRSSLVEEIPTGRAPKPIRFQSVIHSVVDGMAPMTFDAVQGSRVTADAVVVHGEVIGGFITARHRVEAAQLGDPDNTETSIEVTDASGHVAADSVFPGVVVVVAGERHQLKFPRFGAVWQDGSLKGGDNG